MKNYTLATGYQQKEELKESFNRLAIETFNLDFRLWYWRNSRCWMAILNFRLLPIANIFSIKKELSHKVILITS